MSLRGPAAKRRPGTRTALAAGILLFCLAGCAVSPPQSALDLPAQALTVIGTPPVTDARAEFRALFCTVLVRTSPGASATECDDLLWPPRTTTPVPTPTDFPTTIDHRLRILIVGGAFSDCYPPASKAFADSVAQLKSQDVEISNLVVEGRSSSEHNAADIAGQIARLPEDGRLLVLVGYSKGAVDILEALALLNHSAAVRVAAVISIAGAVNGSPLATRYRHLYGHLLAGVTFGGCPPGDRGVLESLTPSVRLEWLAQHPIPGRIRFYSIGIFTTPPRLARALAYPQRQLSKIDTRNDGQLLTRDQLIPGSKLLGYANADHWGVAVHMEDRFPFLAHRSVGPHAYPQLALLESALLFVQRDLSLPPLIGPVR